MSDKYFDKKVDNWMEGIQDAMGHDNLHMVLVIFAKDIERDARQKATSLAYILANDINNMTYDLSTPPTEQKDND